MVMNKAGQVMVYALMIGTCIVILALSMAPVIKQTVDGARNSTNMDCDNESISDYDKAACTVADLSIFYFIGGLIFIAGAVIVAKIILE